MSHSEVLGLGHQHIFRREHPGPPPMFMKVCAMGMREDVQNQGHYLRMLRGVCVPCWPLFLQRMTQYHKHVYLAH
jgi:hypothetical protein